MHGETLTVPSHCLGDGEDSSSGPNLVPDSVPDADPAPDSDPVPDPVPVDLIDCRYWLEIPPTIGEIFLKTFQIP